MRLTIWGRISLLITFYAISWQAWSQPGLQEKYLWRSGQAAVDITPVGSLWMAGYAARNKPAHEKMHSLWVKAVALEDQQKNLGVIISSDLVGIPKEVSDQIRNKLQEKYGIAKAQIMMNSSHTHSGPYMFDSFRPSSFSMPETEIEKVKKYTAKLIDDIVEVASSAINKLEPARVFSGNGTSRFQVNRRNNDEKTLSLYADLNGPNDYAVPVLKIEDTSGEIKGIVFGYACHAT
ncbi:MAG: neutral/alkaline non-lysosomal ceramidase N-terminal domain-containing protein, partial [Saprospiraceae bacterium]|nr:neutral/alkaline non-lysosomal ceramidase N-terminal domain-containing protein [Saprospiraceae bacterium]